jgi:hypothetical protein
MILRRGDGSIIFSACRGLRFCSSALEAELSACLEGINVTLEMSQDGIIVKIVWSWCQWQQIRSGIILAWGI